MKPLGPVAGYSSFSVAPRKAGNKPPQLSSEFSSNSAAQRRKIDLTPWRKVRVFTVLNRFSSYGKPSRNCTLITIQFRNPFSCVTAIRPDPHCVTFVRHNLKVWHSHHDCWHKDCSCKTRPYACNILSRLLGNATNNL
jgi:hypothetical protein